MPRLIIGHVGEREARIWVRGTEKYPVAFLSYSRSTGSSPRDATPLELEERHHYTSVFELEKLTPGAEYRCTATFGTDPSTPPELRNQPESATGSFRTAPASKSGSTTFLMVSCNLHSLGIWSSPDPAYQRISELAREEKADFMLHVGDQIYYDIPVLGKLPDLSEYRDKYHDAWGQSAPTRALLTQLPHYMILDDHEIIDDFNNDMRLNVGKVGYMKEVALKAYREYQHIHNPQTFGSSPLYYTFDRGPAKFFVLDARTERYQNEPGNQMIGEDQLERLFGWLGAKPDRVKFIVTSVPFVGEARNSEDKWCSKAYRPQRNRIIDFITRNQIQDVIFLTGDMHNSYYARMDVERPGQEAIRIHELMSSPVNHFNKGGTHDYVPSFVSETDLDKNKYSSLIDSKSFFGDHSNVMSISVSASEVKWRIYRTKKTRKADRSGVISLGQP